MLYFDRYGKPVTTEQKKLAEAFDYFNTWMNPDSLASNYKKFVQKIENGRHPVADQAFVKIGSHIAQKLQERYGQQQIENYHRIGALKFFEDYFKISGIPEDFQFSERMRETIIDWNDDWEKTWNEYTRSLSIAPFSELDQIGGKLKKTFSGMNIYPDFSGDFAQITQIFYLNEDNQNAIKIGKIAVELYPASSACYAALANANVCSGKREDALKIYKQAIEINPDDRSIGQRALVQYARELIHYNQLDNAEALLKLAIELYPNEPSFYNSMAEIYLLRGKSYLEKALDKDPTNEPARNRLKEIW
jgi:tetratricopeptide (TPR) repeat protein